MKEDKSFPGRFIWEYAVIKMAEQSNAIFVFSSLLFATVISIIGVTVNKNDRSVLLFGEFIPVQHTLSLQNIRL